ncbi:type ISP restriction/modification enzyme [Microbacterium sp. NPDC076911]|uniref:type ISP restriction/modification enzyme n=1 Tax=Microbacterium sp. NPDC076911 TaxID=3154958 RepID=UPI003424AEA1
MASLDSPDFSLFQPIGDEATMGREETQGIFRGFGLGLSTNRDAWVHNFSRDSLRVHLTRSIAHYNSVVEDWKAHRSAMPVVGTDDHLKFIPPDDQEFTWEEQNKADLKHGRTIDFHPEYLRASLYRPFVRQDLYFDPTGRLTARPHIVPALFPATGYANRCIVVSADKNTGVSVLVTNLAPNLHLLDNNQVFAFYTYEALNSTEAARSASDGDVVGDYVRRENITDATLAGYRAAYADDAISKWDIFHYVYAVLHHPSYREICRSDLQKQLPRIPQLANFWQFAQAGETLVELHLKYESQEPYPLEDVHASSEPLDERAKFNYYRVGGAMSWTPDRDHSELRFNRNLTLTGFPPEAQDYQLCGKSAVEWVCEHYTCSQDSKSGIWNDANDLRIDGNDYRVSADDARRIVDLIGRVASVSVETVRIASTLPSYEQLEQQVWGRES